MDYLYQSKYNRQEKKYMKLGYKFKIFEYKTTDKEFIDGMI